MQSDRVREGVWAGLIAAAGTAGALIGFGYGRGTPARPLNAIAHLLVGIRGQATPWFDPLLTPLGFLLHSASLTVWGILFAFLASRLAGWRLAAGALAFAVAVMVIDLRILPRRLSPGFQLTLTSSEVVVVYLIMALLLWQGIALARRSRGPAARDGVG